MQHVTMTEVFISDFHDPFVDEKAWELMSNIVEDIQPDLIFGGGDLTDNYAVSSFDRNAKRVLELQDEYDSTYARLARLRKRCLNSRIEVIPGNHEIRLERYINTRPEMFSIRGLKLQELWQLNKIGAKLIPYAANHKIGHLYHFHGDEVSGGSVYPARGVYLKSQGNIIMGHYHRSQVFYNRLMDGRTHGSWCNPCLCKLEEQDYLKTVTQWQQGFSVIRYFDSGLFHIDQIVFFRIGKKICGVFGDTLYSVSL